MNRKDFFKTTGRIMMLGGITASSGYLVWNKKVSARCSVSEKCEQCGRFQKCELQQAKEVRNGKK